MIVRGNGGKVMYNTRPNFCTHSDFLSTSQMKQNLKDTQVDFVCLVNLIKTPTSRWQLVGFKEKALVIIYGGGRI
jgi:hypothetical protein